MYSGLHISAPLTLPSLHPHSKLLGSVYVANFGVWPGTLHRGSAPSNYFSRGPAMVDVAGAPCGCGPYFCLLSRSTNA